MGLVEYSDSEGSGSEAEVEVVPKAAPKATQPGSKKPFQKVVDRANPGKILVNLPQVASDPSVASNADGEPPAKRARTAGGGRFSGFNSFLPAPKNANKPLSQQKPAAASSQTRPGVHLTTSAAPGFSRDGDGAAENGDVGTSAGMTLPPPKTSAEPSIPEGLKPEEEVKLVGKPMMFKPLSVARNGTKKKNAKPAVPKVSPATSQSVKSSQETNGNGIITKPEGSTNTQPKKVSLFSLHTEEPSEPVSASNQSGTYEPLFATEEAAADGATGPYDEYAQYADYAQTGQAPTTDSGPDSLENIADDLNLSAAARRELFGRDGFQHLAAQRVINFNLDREYANNEEVRATGDQKMHNPVRAIQGGKKHSLRQLVQNVQSQREALEDAWAKGKNNRKEASSKYGW